MHKLKKKKTRINVTYRCECVVAADHASVARVAFQVEKVHDHHARCRHRESRAAVVSVSNSV
jgi:hypothetical protein